MASAPTSDILVSRERELALLRAALSESLREKPEFIILQGESGKGKTSLVRHFFAGLSAQAQDFKLVHVACENETRMTPFAPWIQVIRQIFDINVQADQAEAARKARLQETYRLFVKVAPVWLDLVFKDIPSAVVDTIAEVQKYFNKKPQDSALFSQETIYKQFNDILTVEARKKPLIVFVDDIQWIDQSSLQLLRHLCANLKSSAFLFLGAYRPSLIAPNKEYVHLLNEIIRLGAQPFELSNGIDVGAYLDICFPGHEFPKSFIKDIQKRTDGDPLFVTQLFKMLDEQGQIRHSEGKVTLVSPTTVAINIPTQVRAVIENRVNALESELRGILDVACVEGEDFTAEVIGSTRALDEDDLIDDLTSLERIHHLVMENGELTVRANTVISLFRFEHSFLREYLYEELPGMKRRRLHAQVAACLEALYGDQSKQIAERLALHHLNGGQQEKAAAYFVMAAEAAHKKYGWLEAVDLASQAYALLKDKENADAIRNLARAALVWEESAACLDRSKEVIAPLKVCIKLLKQTNEKVLLTRVLIALARVYYWLGDPVAKPIAVEAVDLATQIGDLPLIFEAKYILKDVVEDIDGKYQQSIAMVDELLTLADQLNDPTRKIDCLGMLAWNHTYLGSCSQAVTECKQALELLTREEINDPYLEYMLYRFLGLAYYGLGQYEDALLYSNRAADGYKHLDDQKRMAFCQEEIGATYLEMREYGKAERAFQDSLTNARASTESWINVDRAALWLAQGEVARAEQYLTELQRSMGQDGADDGSKIDWIDLQLTWAQLFLKKGQLQKALEVIEDVKRAEQEIDTDIRRLPIEQICGQIAAAQQQYPEAIAHYTAMQQLACQKELRVWEAKACLGLGDVQRETREMGAAWDNYRNALEIFEDFKHHWEIPDIYKKMILVGVELGKMRRLSRVYPCRSGKPVLEYVDVAIFQEKYFKDCLSCGFCHDSCCQYGVDIDILNVRRITQYSLELEKYIAIPRKHWFADPFVPDDEFPGGRYTRTQVYQGACVFLNRGGRGCNLHSFCLEKGIDYHELKPFVSCLFPLTFDYGLLHPSLEIEDKDLACYGAGHSLYRGIRDELLYYYGPAMVAELDEIEKALG